MKKMIIMILCLVMVGCTSQSNSSTATTTTVNNEVEDTRTAAQKLFDERDVLNCTFDVKPNGDIYKVNGTCESNSDEEIYVNSMELVGVEEAQFSYFFSKGVVVGPKGSFDVSFDSYKYLEEYGGLKLKQYSYVNAAMDTVMNINEVSKNSLKSNYIEESKKEEEKVSEEYSKHNVLEFAFEVANVEYETVYTVYEAVITNTADYDVYLNDMRFVSDNIINIDLLIPANSTITKLYSLHTDTTGVNPLVESDYEDHTFLQSYTYYVGDKDYSIELTDKDIYISDHSDYTYSEEGLSYARRMNNGFTIYAWLENGSWCFDYLEGREFEFEDLNVAGIFAPNTIYDFALSTFNGFEENMLYNLVDGEVVIDDEVKKYIETAAEELGLNFVYNNDYSTVNIDDYRGIDTMTLREDESFPGLYLVATYIENPYAFTEEEKAKIGSTVYTKEDIVELVLNETLNQYVYIVGKDSPLTEDQKNELITYFEKNHVYASYEGDKEIYVFKPVIYIYGEEDMDVHVEVEGDLCISYPLYNDGWDVTIEDGKLVSGDRSYEYLYYEANVDDVFSRDVGFVVSREDSISFLEEKLAILGLNEREMNDMITFWLPYLYQNKYNFISFQSETYSELVPLHVSPTPDTMIRIYMLIDGLEEYKDVKEQVLTPVTRNGYTVVEWGGSYLE